MSAAAYNRGSAVLTRAADAKMPAAHARADLAADADERAALVARVAQLEVELRRARRCVAELRRSKDARLSEARADAARSSLAISILCRIAFGAETPS